MNVHICPDCHAATEPNGENSGWRYCGPCDSPMPGWPNELARHGDVFVTWEGGWLIVRWEEGDVLTRTNIGPGHDPDIARLLARVTLEALTSGRRLGERVGRAKLQEELRKLIGAAAPPEPDDGR